VATEDERLRELDRVIAELKVVQINFSKLLSQQYATIAWWFRKRDYVFADPHGTWGGHLDGAYSEGEQIKNTLQSVVGHNVTMIRHPVSKSDFLNNLSNKNIVHLAGHGGCNGQVYFCFDDGNIYPSDVSALASAPELLFYAGVCLGGKNDTMANAFRTKGTKYYVGFWKSIPDWNAKYFDDLVYEKWLVDGKDLRTALDEADDLYPDLNCWVLWE
jgi:hypothetical protein